MSCDQQLACLSQLSQKTDSNARRLLWVVFEPVVPLGLVESDRKHGVTSERQRFTMGVMSLVPRNDTPLQWMVTQNSDDRESEFVSWTIAIDAMTGQVVVETLSRRFNYFIIAARQRAFDGSWTEVPPPSWFTAAQEKKTRR